VVRGNPSVVRPQVAVAETGDDDLVARIASNDLEGDGDNDVGALAVAVIERPPAAAARVAPPASTARAVPAPQAPTAAAAKPRSAAAPVRAFRFSGLLGWLAPRFLHR
jgi:hypothetical protein